MHGDGRERRPRAAAQLAGSGTPENQRLIESCQGLVRSLAWSIHRRLPPHVELDDLIAFGQVGLAEAARDFDSAKGRKFSTYAYYRVRGAIFDGLSTLNWFSRYDYHSRRYEQMANELLAVDDADESSSDAADEDSEEALRRDVKWFRNVTTTMAVVYLAVHADSGGIDLEDRRSRSPSSAASAEETRERLHELIDALPSDAGALIRDVYFGGMTIKEAGDRLGISKAWASRLHTKTLERLARSLRTIGIDTDRED